MRSVALLWEFKRAFFLQRAAERRGRSEECEGNGRCLPFTRVREALSRLPCCKCPGAAGHEVEVGRRRGNW